jgi:putative SOS response-associated peptidase YedK
MTRLLESGDSTASCPGFYEWKVMEGGRKQPFYIKPAIEETFAFAALWDKSITQGGETILSCAVITMPANEFCAIFTTASSACRRF